MIPKNIHIVWVGDESKRPDNCINTWISHNPSWTVKIWGNAELTTTPWINRAHIAEMSRSQWCGVADLMRWEILYMHGGFAVDADAICVKPLPDWLLDHEIFACWENEVARPGLIANGYVGSHPQNPLVGQIILDIHAEKTVIDRLAWVSTGPLRLTETWRNNKYRNLSILPSHYFIPQHYEGSEYQGSGHVFAKQFWGSTGASLYDDLYLRNL
jgi:mannosyltransferase OCH1-like enzyme